MGGYREDLKTNLYTAEQEDAQWAEPGSGPLPLNALKVKVEDPNDLNMARQAVSDAHRFLEHLTSYAQEKSQTVYESLCKFRA